jgi:prophage maintenance system killer protein
MCKNGYHIVRTELLDESLHLNSLLSRLFVKSSCSQVMDLSRFLKEDVIRHSVEIELGSLRGPQKRRMKRASERNLYRAFDWANQNYTGELSYDYIAGIGSHVDPVENQFGYRTENRRINGSWKLPPSWEKIEREMGDFLFENSCIDEPLEKAIHAHLHIARIHPFMDGNGRTARLLQNVILERNSYLPILSLISEREDYINLIGRAVIGYCDARARTVDTRQEQDFRRYVEKPSLSLKEIGICKSLALDLAMKRYDPAVTDFFNYLAEKEVRQLRNMCDKLLGGIRIS